MMNLKGLNYSNLQIKALASTKFISSLKGLDDINNSKNETESQSSKVDLKFNFVLNQGIDSINRFINTNQTNFALLEFSAIKFTESLEIKKNKPEPYFYLSTIYKYMGNNDLALNYAKIVILIDDSFPGLSELLQNISQVEEKIEKDKTVKKEENNISTNNEPSKTQPVGVAFKPTAMVRKATNYSKF